MPINSASYGKDVGERVYTFQRFSLCSGRNHSLALEARFAMTPDKWSVSLALAPEWLSLGASFLSPLFSTAKSFNVPSGAEWCNSAIGCGDGDGDGDEDREL